MPLTPAPINPEAIQAEAEKAAWLYSDIKSACPYPWGSDEGKLFKAAFETARQTMNYGSTHPAA